MKKVPVPCPLCAVPVEAAALRPIDGDDGALVDRIRADHPDWVQKDGLCPTCVQHYLLEMIHLEGEAADRRIQENWPLDACAVFGVIPTPLRLRANPHATGRGVTIAVIDSGFYPHPDLVEPTNRIKAYVACTLSGARVKAFTKKAKPSWPGSAKPPSVSWHGMMTSVTLAGNGRLSKGLYRSLAPQAEVVLVKVAGPKAKIGDRQIEAGLKWVLENHRRFEIRIVNLSLGGDKPISSKASRVDRLVEKLTEEGVVTVVAAGNGGVRRLVPPGSAPSAITVGGLDDKNTFARDEWSVWQANWGKTADGIWKPEVVAPSIWVVAPILPKTATAREAAALVGIRHASPRRMVTLVKKAPPPIRGWRFGSTPGIRAAVEERIAMLKLVTEHYQHVDGTSFASPIVASVVAQMLEVNPALTPRAVKDILVRTAERLAGVPADRQGSGVVSAPAAVAASLRESEVVPEKRERSPHVRARVVDFYFVDEAAKAVAVVGDFNKWAPEVLPMLRGKNGRFHARMQRPPAGVHRYKFLVDGSRWIEDPENAAKDADGYGGFNSLLRIE